MLTAVCALDAMTSGDESVAHLSEEAIWLSEDWFSLKHYEGLAIK